MKKLLASILCAAALAPSVFAASPAATMSWVSNYVATAIANNTVVQSNAVGKTVYTVGSTTMIVEDADVYALYATNATALAVSSGVTNNMFFVWNETDHVYTNATQTITATPSNLVWNAVQSDGGSFPEYFDVVGCFIQPTFAAEVTK